MTNKIIQGDVFEVLASLPDQSVDLILGSPPYEQQRDYAEVQFDLKGQDWVDWMVEVFDESLRVCRGLVAYVVGHGVTKNYKWSCTPALLIAELHRYGYCVRDPKWYKRNGIPGSGGPDDMRKDLEFIVCATNGGKLPWSDNKACGHPPKCPTGGALTYRRKDGSRRQVRGVTSGYKAGDARYETLDRAVTDIANPGNVIDCGAVGGGNIGHKIAHENEAPYPEKLAKFFIRSYCPPDGIVFDPFGGSGTTAAMAIATGRRFITSDIRTSQIKLIKRRIKAVSKRKGFNL